MNTQYVGVWFVMNCGTIVSLDNMNEYYDPALKEYRLSLIKEAATTSPIRHIFVKGNIADKALIDISLSITLM